MEEASSSSRREANDQTNVCNCKNKNEDEITVTEPKISKQTEGAQSSIDDQGEDEYYARYWPLYRMIEKNDWRGVEDFVTNHPDALTATTVAPGSTTIFHAIVESLVDVESDDATCLLDKLASKVDPQTLARQDVHGQTALYQCAGKGNLRALKVLVKYNPDLTTIRNKGDILPVHVAAYEGHKDTFQYLLEVTREVDIYSGYDGANMLSCLIDANLYDVALDLLKLHPTIGRDNINSRRVVLNSLARKPYAFESGSRLGRLQRLIYNSPSIKSIHEQKLAHMQAVEIVRIICKEVVWTCQGIELDWALFTAARLGIHEFVNEFIMAYNRTTDVLNEDRRNIFDVAVLHRREKVFNLIHRVNYTTDLFSTEGNSGNNILHLAAKLVPSSEVAGAALQMQRELQWFKAVEKLIHPAMLGDENSSKKTAREVFTEEHKELVKEGEKWMKETASSCSVVAALIITVVFAAAFTVPGGSDSRGIPNILHEPSFMIFAISDILALFSSISSVLMFLGILTSRYAEDDFLLSLPRKLIIGLVTLFFSIASMMVAFGATVHISLSHKWNLVIIPIALVGCVPVTLFALLQFPLLLDMYSSTYGRSIIIDSSWRELASCDLVD
ncbi:ANK REP REGION domain-containing protein [Citrus sinensis]|uniref:ANK REP REGION domain-containing protein n=1 Tax=Citrus sinensis TaxID=2711 RepID=A0ACB8K8J1_CITSI|nr:ANK REP REGION domain-containing protein [Citrus sinensis]